MIPQLIKMVRQYRSDVEGRIDSLRHELGQGKRSPAMSFDPEVLNDSLAAAQTKLGMIDQSLRIPVKLEDGARLIAGTFLISLDRETNPEPMDELGDVLAELVMLDVDMEGTGRICHAAEITDTVDVTELVVALPNLNGAEIELSDGGVIVYHDDDDRICRQDKDGNGEEVRRPGDGDYDEWKQLFLDKGLVSL